VWPEYVQIHPVYNNKGELNEDVLIPDCIESRDWDLSAGKYKPLDFSQLRTEKSVLEIIDQLRKVEKEVFAGLDRLQALVEGR